MVYSVRRIQFIGLGAGAGIAQRYSERYIFERNALAEVSFGEWLKRRRKAEGFTQEQLAERVSCSTITLRKMEAEERRPSAQIVGRLAEIFHIPPNEQTKFLRFARGDWTAAPANESEDAPWQTSKPVNRSHLPSRLNALVGREQEVAQIRRYLATEGTRLVTLVGPPGIGKTSLSQRVATDLLGEYGDGVFFVALASLNDPTLVAPTIAQTLRFEGRGYTSAEDLLKQGIGDKQMLLVLDNFEHILEAAPLVPELLTACPNLKILITSREALRVPGEWLYAVPPLAIPQIRQSNEMDFAAIHDFSTLILFEERARAVRSDFKLNPENANVVARICAQLDGLPLAIELIAARVRLMSPQELLVRMSDQFTLYADGMRAMPARQKTLHNAIAWSYDLLTPEEQKLFAHLSVLAGGFTLEAAAQVTENPKVFDGITALLDKSMLQRASDEQGATRFTMLFTIREFALSKLNEMHEARELCDQHLNYFLKLAEQADQDMYGPRQIEWLDRLEAEHDNYRAALDWCVMNEYAEPALRLIGIFCGPGCRLWSIRGYFSEARKWFDKVRALSAVSQVPLTHATALNGMSFVIALEGDFPFARSLAEESKRICEALESEGERTLAGALTALGLAEYWGFGNQTLVKTYFEQAAKIYQTCGSRWEQAMAVCRLGMIEQDGQQAMHYLEDSLATLKEYGDAFGLARVYDVLEGKYSHQGNSELARKMGEQAVNFDRRVCFWAGLYRTLTNLGAICRIQNDYDQAKVYLEEALRMEREFNVGENVSTYYYLGCVLLHQENYPEARKQFLDYARNSLKVDVKINLGESLIGLAAVAAGLKQYERAAVLTGAAQAVHDMISYKMPPRDLIEIDPLLQQARHQLGERKFEELATEGRPMTIEQAIEYALKNQD